MRTLGIARAMRRLDPGAEILFLTNSEAPHLISGDGFAVVKMLSPVAGASRKDLQLASRINLGIARSTIVAFDPDVIAVDFFPLGQLGSLSWIGQHRAHKIFIAREPNPRQAQDPALARDINAIYQAVILPHREGEGITTPMVSAPLHHTGAILVRSRDEAISRNVARRLLGIPESAFAVYVGFGGGGRRDLDSARAWVLSVATDFPEWRFSFARPPLYRGEPARFHIPNAVEFSYAPLAECWTAFDLAVSSLSFNSASELLHFGVPAIFVNMPASSDDWSRRGKMISDAEAGIVVSLGDTDGLRAALTRLANHRDRQAISSNANRLVPDNGAERAVRIITEITNGQLTSGGTLAAATLHRGDGTRAVEGTISEQ